MSARVVSDRRDFAHVLSNTAIKSGKAENDFAPQKGALSAIKEVLDQMQEKKRPLEEKMNRLEEVFKDVEKAGGKASKSQQMEILSLLKQIQKEMGEMNANFGMVQNAANGGNDVGQANGNSNPGSDPYPLPDGNVTIMAGALALAEKILLELQQKYQELQQIITKISISNINDTPAVVAFMKNAAVDSYGQDAKNQRLEAGRNGAQIALTAYGLKQSAGNYSDLQARTAPLDAERTDLVGLQKGLSGAPSTVVSDRPNPRPDPAQRDAYIQRFRDGNFDKLAGDAGGEGRSDAIKHLRGNVAGGGAAAPEKAEVAKILQDKITEKTTAINTEHTAYSRADSTSQMRNQMFGSLKDAAFQATESVYTARKGQNEAESKTSSVISDQLSTAAKDTKEKADGQVQNAAQALQARQALMDQNNRALGG